LGNENNFGTEKECLQRCRTEGVCVSVPYMIDEDTNLHNDMGITLTA